MELSLPSPSSLRFPQKDFVPLHKFSRPGSFHTFSNKNLASKSISLFTPLIWRQHRLVTPKAQSSIDSNGTADKHGDDDFIIEDVPHLTHFLPDLLVISEILE